MRKFRPLVALAFLLSCGAFGVACVGGSKGLSSEDKEKLKPYILESAPADMPHKVDINFENKVHIVGYKIDPEQAKPGADVKLTYWWRVDDTIDDGWLLFTHTKDEGNGKMGNLDFSGPLREQRNGGSHQVLGPERWEKGKVYQDEQTYTVPSDVTGSEVTITVGIWKGDARLRVISGPNDGDNSAIVGKIKTGVAPKPASEEHTSNDPPALVVTKVADLGKITVDGKADEPEWGGAASTGPFVDVGSGKPPTGVIQGSAKVLWDDKNVYVFYDAKAPDPYVGFTDAKSQPADWTAGGQPKLWTKDTVEMMVDPGPEGDNVNYYELQFNPQNKVFKSQFDTLQKPSGDPDKGPFGHEDWDPKLKSAVQLQKGADGKATGYSVEIAIPWTGFAKGAQNVPPKPGDAWRMNFYVMRENGSKGAASWSPILGQGNFHKASRFGKVTWAVPGQPGVPPAPVLVPMPGIASGAAPMPMGPMGPRMVPNPRGPIPMRIPPALPAGQGAPPP